MKIKTLIYRGTNGTEYKVKAREIWSGSITLNNKILLMYMDDNNKDITIVCEHFRFDY